jgi:hypothetical protein
VTFISSIPPPDVGDNIWLLGDLPIGATGSIMITVMVDSGVPSGSLLVNNVTVTYEDIAGSPSQNWAEASTLVVGLAVDLISPDGGELWMGGSSQSIIWNMTDNNPISDLTVDITYSTDGGITFPNTIATALTGYPSNPCIHNWDPIPTIDCTTVKVRIVVTDTSFNTAQDQSQDNFTIDSTAPLPATNPNAELVGLHVEVTWTDSISLDIDRFEIWFDTNDWDSTGDTYTLLSTIAPGVETYTHANRGVNNANAYFYQVRTFDIAGHETRTLIQAAKLGRTIPVSQSNWWLLGSFLAQSDTSLNHVIQGQGLPANRDMVFSWDSVNQKWMSYVEGRPPIFNDLTDITNEMGFWLHITSSIRLTTAGHVTDMNIDMEAGWNLVAYPYAQRYKTTAQIETDLTINCPGYVPGSLMIMDYSQPYGLKVPDGTETIPHEEGFWIRTIFDCTWSVINY